MLPQSLMQLAAERSEISIAHHSRRRLWRAPRRTHTRLKQRVVSEAHAHQRVRLQKQRRRDKAVWRRDAIDRCLQCRGQRGARCEVRDEGFAGCAVGGVWRQPRKDLQLHHAQHERRHRKVLFRFEARRMKEAET